MALPRPDGPQFNAEDTISRPTPPDPREIKKYSKANIEAMRRKLSSGESVEAVDPGDNDWRYKKNPDGSIEIISAPHTNKRAVGMVLEPGQRFYSAIDSGVFGEKATPYKEPGSSTTAPAKDAEEAPTMSNKDKSRAVMSDSISRMGEEIETSKPDRMVDGRNISATARRLSKRNRLIDDKMTTVKDLE